MWTLYNMLDGHLRVYYSIEFLSSNTVAVHGEAVCVTLLAVVDASTCHKKGQEMSKLYAHI